MSHVVRRLSHASQMTVGVLPSQPPHLRGGSPPRFHGQRTSALPLPAGASPRALSLLISPFRVSVSLSPGPSCAHQCPARTAPSRPESSNEEAHELSRRFGSV